MIDPAVERQYADTKELLALWNTFHQFFTLGVKGENVTPEMENQFLEVKSRIAMLHDSFMEALTANQNVGQDVLSIITRAITLRHLGRLSTADTKKLEIEWHESYLLLNDTIAALEEKRRELADINETQYKAGLAAGVARQKVGTVVTSFYFKLAVGLIILFAATVGVQMFDVYDYDELGKVSALETPYRWGKAAVRKVYNPDSTWPTIDLVSRTDHSSWPEGVKPPVVSSDLTKELAIRKLATITNPIRISQPLAAALAKSTDFKYETAEKAQKQAIEIYTFYFLNADDAKAVEKIYEDAKSQFNSGNGQAPEITRQMDVVRDVNIITFVFHTEGETMQRMVREVYGKRA